MDDGNKGRRDLAGPHSSSPVSLQMVSDLSSLTVTDDRGRVMIKRLNEIVLPLERQLGAERERNGKLETALENETMKNRGMNMLFDCMQEERAENRRLQNLLKRQKLSLRKLSKRLNTMPNIDVAINWEEFLDLNEIEECLSNDLKRNESQLDDSIERKLNNQQITNNPEQTSSLNELTKKLEELRLENDQLTNQLTSSSDIKHAEILKLKKLLQETEKSRQASGILCDGLSEEAIVLKRHLADTVTMCQKVMHALAVKRDFVKKLTNFVPENISVESQKFHEHNVTTSALTQQYVNLERKLKEVVTMNSRWQQYNEQREEYVQQLLQRNAELEQALVNRGQQQLTMIQQEQIDQLLLQQKHKTEVALEEKVKLENEKHKLIQQMDEMKLNVGRTDVTIRNLHDKTTRETQMHARDKKTSEEMIETLKMQLQVFRDDFESERRDRERAQEQIAQLQQQIQSASQQLCLTRSQPLSEYPRENTSYRRQQSLGQSPPEASLVGRGSVSVLNDIEDDEDSKTNSEDFDLQPTE